MRRILHADRPGYQRGLDAVHAAASLAARDAAITAVEAWANKVCDAADAARQAGLDSAADDMKEKAERAIEWCDEYLADDLPLRPAYLAELIKAAAQRVTELAGRPHEECTVGDAREGSMLIEVAARAAEVDLTEVPDREGQEGRWTCKRGELSRLLRAVRAWTPPAPPATGPCTGPHPNDTARTCGDPGTGDPPRCPVHADELPF